MRRYSPGYYSPPRRGYGGRGRSPPRGGGGGGYGRQKDSNHGSLLVRNIPMDCRPEELRIPFERFGVVRDVYIPKDYYTRKPRGFAFVQFVDAHDSLEAQYHMNGQIFAGREITVVLAAESRKKPDEMRRKTRQRSGSRYGGRRSPYRQSASRSVSRSRSPHHPSGSRGGRRSRSFSGSPRRRNDYSASPGRRPSERSRSPRGSPPAEEVRRSYSPKYDDPNEITDRKSKYDAEDARGRRDSPRRQSRSRSVDASPGRSV
ncbi:hypothetical protein vseg_005525 [Gypsophila vaccaria]